ncbi:uncharacterized protein [Argopecten irradians]
MHFEEKTPEGGICAGRCAQGINKLLLILVVFLTVLATIVIAVLIWKETSAPDTNLTKTTLKKKYPGYFWTKEEQSELEQKWRSNRYVPAEKNFTSNLNCGLYCYPGTTNGSTQPTGLPRKRRQVSDTTFNGCCQSSTFFISPDFQDNLAGRSREFVKVEGAQQFFQSGSCEFLVGCTGCTCEMTQEIETAVVYKSGENADSADDIDDVEIDTFFFEKCCRCVNIGN